MGLWQRSTPWRDPAVGDWGKDARWPGENTTLRLARCTMLYHQGINPIRQAAGRRHLRQHGTALSRLVSAGSSRRGQGISAESVVLCVRSCCGDVVLTWRAVTTRPRSHHGEGVYVVPSRVDYRWPLLQWKSERDTWVRWCRSIRRDLLPACAMTILQGSLSAAMRTACGADRAWGQGRSSPLGVLSVTGRRP